jgi:predicted phosphodiesterase
MIVLMSDIHSNLEALEAVLTQMDPGDEAICVGDVVGYGPSPNECCDLLRRRNIRSVMGNHDFVCANLRDMEDEDGEMSPEDRRLCRRLYECKNPAAQAASRWTSSVLTEQNRQWLRGLPVKLQVDGLTLMHGRPGSPEETLNEYVLPGQGTEGAAEQVEGELLVLGHSHIPMRAPRLLNPGSVGQPRDRNWKASYATVDPVKFRFRFIPKQTMSFRLISQIVKIRRVSYDIGRTVQKIKDVPELPDTLGDRLTVGI